MAPELWEPGELEELGRQRRRLFAETEANTQELRRAIRQARASMSVQEIAQALELTRARVYQLMERRD